MTQKSPAELRAEAEAAIKPLGQQRIELLARLEEIERDLRPLIKEAVRMEVPYRRITELTGVAPNTARAWSTKTK
ncbi:hypothetical protein [Polymorphobacter fuscus]|uniref:Uncharacterized protein n=2 Tax=Bacteria TaxID=2 RepID=A0A7C9GRY0_9SPHN|nr:hypothetical protein [Polymorphobacter fuscus]KAB7643569.1 hypothetical protein F9290_15925 [Polymorphobacter fuscus]MQT18736.1 hypothetical protein [Polymorphobacter fuscus]